MKKNPKKLYSALPCNFLSYLSINAMLSELSEANDGILKLKELPKNDRDYYNRCYRTRQFSKAVYYKAICIREIL